MAEDLTKEQITSKWFFLYTVWFDVIRHCFLIQVLRRAFDMFDREKKGSIACNMVGGILRTLGQTFEESDLQSLIEEIDADGSGQLEFDEFLTLTARFLVEEDAEAMQEELREAFRLYDKEGQLVEQTNWIHRNCIMDN